MTSITTDAVLCHLLKRINQEHMIGDSGASCYYCNSDEGLSFYQAMISERITDDNGSTIMTEKLGKQRSCVLKCDGNTP
jgi:hypothetical protein